MRSILNFFFLLAGITVVLMACDKADTLPLYTNGSAPTLSASSTTIAPTPADSDNVALTLSWSNPKYATDSSANKYIVQIDSSGKDFSNAMSRTVTGSLSTSFIAKDFNSMLIALGFEFGVTYSVDVRI